VGNTQQNHDTVGITTPYRYLDSCTQAQATPTIIKLDSYMSG